jgi:hypothetical protein
MERGGEQEASLTEEDAIELDESVEVTEQGRPEIAAAADADEPAGAAAAAQSAADLPDDGDGDGGAAVPPSSSSPPPPSESSPTQRAAGSDARQACSFYLRTGTCAVSQ